MAIWTIESKLPAHLDQYDYGKGEVARLAKQVASNRYKEDLAARCDFVLVMGSDLGLDNLALLEEDESAQSEVAEAMNRIGCVPR